MTLIHSGNAGLAKRRDETVRSNAQFANSPSTKKTSHHDKSPKGQNTRKADKSPVTTGRRQPK